MSTVSSTLGVEFFELRFSNIALTFSFNLPTVEQDTDTEDTATATAGTDRRSFGVAARKLEGGYRMLLRLGVEFFELRFSNIALTFSFNLPTVEQDTDTEDTAMATAGTDGRSFSVAVRKLEGKSSTLAYSFSRFDFRTSRSLFPSIYPL